MKATGKIKSTLIALTIFCLMAGLSLAAELDKSFFSKAEIDLGLMRATSSTLSELLDDARRQRNAKMIGCFEDRLVEIQEIIAASEQLTIELREAAASQDFNAVEKKAKQIHTNRDRVDELVKLVTNCQIKINQPGGFTEVTEVQSDEDEGDDPTGKDEDEGRPDPLPPEYEPPECPSPC